ncbi:hypothetical protein KW481_03290 [Vibrio fluvialis]|nr:hypothetical protein [Vibrio fluvialis]
MYINKAISIHGGWESLEGKPKALAELRHIFNELTYSSLLESENDKYTFAELGQVRQITIDSDLRRKAFQTGWNRSHREMKETASSYIPFLKYGVSLRHSTSVGRGLENGMDRWCLVDVVRHQSIEACDLSVFAVWESAPAWLRIPSSMKNGATPYTSEDLIHHIESKIFPLYHQCPMVILTLSEEELPLEVIELSYFQHQPNFERVLEFTPENYQAGVGILSYFGEVLKQKYPDIEAKVRIEQDDCFVRMTIDTPDGNREIIEEALDTYTQVVIKEKEPEALLNDKIQISELKMQLSMIETQLQHKKELLMLADDRYKNDVVATRNEVEFLRLCLSKQMQMTQDSHVLIGKQIDKEKDVTLAQLSYFDNTIQALVDQSYGNEALIDALYQLQNLLDRGVSAKDEHESKEVLEIIKHESPSTYDQLSELLKNSMYGVSGNMIFTWMTEIAKQLC